MIALVAAPLALFAKLTGWFKLSLLPTLTAKKRILIEYAMLAVVIATATLALTMWVERWQLRKELTTANGEISSLQGRVQTVEAVNLAHQATILDLQALREQDSSTLTGLVGDYERLNERDRNVRRQLTDLEKNNAEVRALLDQPLPPELRELLNKR